jgi:serine/threonine protein kinase
MALFDEDLFDEDLNVRDRNLFLGPYYLLEYLGEGASAIVFEVLDVRISASDSSTARRAIKIFSPGQEIDRKWRHEVTAYETLSRAPSCSEAVVCLYEADFYDSRSMEPDFDVLLQAHRLGLNVVPVEGQYHYLVTEYMDGNLSDLKRRLGANWISAHPQVMIGMAQRLIEGLSTIHAVGLAHMDIKPENIFYRFVEGRSLEEFKEQPRLEDLIIKYGDLGFACTYRTDTTTPFLAQCQPQGTPDFMAPEIIRIYLVLGRTYPLRLQLAQKSDVWSLGLTLWELIYEEATLSDAGDKYLRNGNSFRYNIIYNTFRRFLTRRSYIPPLRRVFAAMIEKSPWRRASTDELGGYF